MKGLFERRWRKDHEGCAWCDKPALVFDIDTAGEKVGACKKHKDNLATIRHARQAKLIGEAVFRDKRIDRALRGRKR